jgi:hypothetical protein
VRRSADAVRYGLQGLVIIIIIIIIITWVLANHRSMQLQQSQSSVQQSALSMQYQTA